MHGCWWLVMALLLNRIQLTQQIPNEILFDVNDCVTSCSHTFNISIDLIIIDYRRTKRNIESKSDAELTSKQSKRKKFRFKKPKVVFAKQEKAPKFKTSDGKINLIIKKLWHETGPNLFQNLWSKCRSHPLICASSGFGGLLSTILIITGVATLIIGNMGDDEVLTTVSLVEDDEITTVTELNSNDETSSEYENIAVS